MMAQPDNMDNPITIIPDLYQFAIPAPAGMGNPVNIYIIDSPDGLLLIDAGYGGEAAYQSFTEQLECGCLLYSDFSVLKLF